MRPDRWKRSRWIVVMLAAGLVAAAAGGSVGAATAETKDGAQAKVDINKATESELMTVSGIGETLAKRIVEFRDKNGPYRRLEDLMKVQGIGEKSFEKLRSHLTVGKES